MDEKDAHKTQKPHDHGKGKKRKRKSPYTTDVLQSVQKKHKRLFDTLERW